MSQPFTVKDSDKGWDELRQTVLKLGGGYHVLVGVQGAQAAANHQGTTGITIADIASVHEFGRTIKTRRGEIVIPERSFIRAGIDEHRSRIQKRATLVGAGVLLLKFTTHQALSLLGEYAVGLLKSRIARGIEPPNRPRTVARKGSSKPLIDTGQLRNSITYAIEDG